MISSNYLKLSLWTICLTSLFLIYNGTIVFGAVHGGWTFPRRQGLFSLQQITAAFILSFFGFFIVTLRPKMERLIEKRELTCITLIFIAGLLFSHSFTFLFPYELGNVIMSDTANSFYSPTLKYSFLELASRHHQLFHELPLHATSNMFGKIAFFYFLKLFTSSPQVLAYIIISISSFASILIYYIAKMLLGNKTVALYSMLLYFLIPSKLFFFPLLNTISPLFAFAPFLWLLIYLRTKQTIYLLGLGISFYALFIFEPTPLIGGIVLASIVFHHYLKIGLTRRQLSSIAILPTVMFVLSYLIVRGALGYDAIDNFQKILMQAKSFNQSRPYDVWVVQNLKNFFLNAGILQSCLYLGTLAYLLATLFQRALGRMKPTPKNGNGTAKNSTKNPAYILLIAFTVMLITLDLLGVTRGEVIRLWIFLAVYIQFAAAYICFQYRNYHLIDIVLLSSFAQSVLTIFIVQFII